MCEPLKMVGGRERVSHGLLLYHLEACVSSEMNLGDPDGHVVVELEDNHSGKRAVVYAHEHAWIDGFLARYQLVDVGVGICKLPMQTILRDSIEGPHNHQSSVRGYMHLGWFWDIYVPLKSGIALDVSLCHVKGERIRSSGDAARERSRRWENRLTVGASFAIFLNSLSV